MSTTPLAPLEFEKPIRELEAILAQVTAKAASQKLDLSREIEALHQRLEETKRSVYSALTPWQRVQIVRHPARPYTLDYLRLIASEWIELHGDRAYGNDRALIGGLAMIGTERVLLVGHQKGRDVKENIMRNFGCAHPEGYRKALRLMQMADKFKLPILCMIDTPGAYPGVASEERHVAEAIAVNIREMFNLNVPILAIVIGEGGSGGALGIGVADRVLILENAYYSVISPEGCASILWKDRAYAPQAAAALKMSAPDLAKLGLVDEVLPEPQGGAHYDPNAAAETVKEAILRHLVELKSIPMKQLLEGRYQRYRNYGSFQEG